ncbi:hypothetical protein GJ633_05230 [Halorubrum sp. CBA1125]|uniref:hypothetical protein n=1 Tax=Halorubrum sp. CBA1125 TaxID=2668072 RepID=UPI0012E73125|nr:hypothetical protein [Halorubrum sp. CBA1125]MUW14127.1 hypothetical protein [Halorubrum sp. CBA1125]
MAIDRRNAAIARSTATAPLSVRSTPTALSVDASVDDESLTASGRLTAETEAGGERGLTGRTVSLSIDGTDVGTAETGPDGRYRVEIAVPASIEPGERGSITAAFDGTGTNLLGSTAEGTVVVPRGNADGNGADAT